MENNELNRMATSRNRGGRPRKETIEAREAPVPVVEVEITLPPIRGIICPWCGRGTELKVIRTIGNVRECLCFFCDQKKQIKITYGSDGSPQTLQKLYKNR
jgi:hypothetical protein